MGTVAAPAYLGADFSTAPPGHRFSLYLPLWISASWAREPDKSSNKDGSPAAGKTPTLLSVVKLGDFVRLSEQLGTRQSALAAPLAAQGSLLTLHAKSIAPFTTGLGNEHPLENGFAFLNPYGLPYLPGSGVKGVLRTAALELASGDWGDTQGWSHAAIDALFGKAGKDDEDPGFQRGALMFWDVLPQIEGDALQVEVMTPHQSHYYQGDKSPHESGQPNPINFLTVPPRSKFVFHVQCDLPFLARIAPALARDQQWQVLIKAAMAHAFEWLGFGAKTAVGYGAMASDSIGQARADKAREEAIVEAELKTLSPAGRVVKEFIVAMQQRAEQLKGRKDKPNTEFHQRAQKLASSALADATWNAAERAAAADAIELWLPQVVALPDIRDAVKKLKLRALRGLT